MRLINLENLSDIEIVCDRIYKIFTYIQGIDYTGWVYKGDITTDHPSDIIWYDENKHYIKDNIVYFKDYLRLNYKGDNMRSLCVFYEDVEEAKKDLLMLEKDFDNLSIIKRRDKWEDW